MARALADGAESVLGVQVVLKRVAEGCGELANADGIILGSSTHHTQPSQAMKLQGQLTTFGLQKSG